MSSRVMPCELEKPHMWYRDLLVWTVLYFVSHLKGVCMCVCAYAHLILLFRTRHVASKVHMG